jgi:nitrogenase molybdenum-iron protein alpha/beta subunit
MALILRSTIPRALMIIPQKLSNVKVQSVVPILESCENIPSKNNPSIENTITANTQLVHTARNINKIVEKMQKEYKIECCNECGTC